MNWYYAKNGAQHGPVPLETLVDKISMGEVAPTDLAWREGLADWAPVSTIAELKPKAPEPVEAPLSAGVPAAQAEPYRPPVSAAPAAYPAPSATATPPPASGLAIGALVCGVLAILSCCVWPFSLVFVLSGIILGHLALGKIKADPSRQGGRGLAKAGLITGYVGLILFLIGAGFYMMVGSMNPEDVQEKIIQMFPEEQQQEIRRELEKKQRGTSGEP